MGISDDDDDVPDSYLCEQCGPDDHRETLQALARGDKIWETRNKIYMNEKKMSKNRKGKQGKGWLKKDMLEEETGEQGDQETGNKRKRTEEVKDELVQADVKPDTEEDEPPARSSARQEKRRKSAAPPDPETEIVGMERLPADRKKIAGALGKIIADDINARAKAGSYQVREGHTAKSLGEHFALRIEYSLKMNHGETSSEGYLAQFRTLSHNLKKNKMLIERLLNDNVTPDELSTMSSSDLASEELQKENAKMKEQLDRQAIVTEAEGPRYRRTHKGDELIEDENAQMATTSTAAAQPVRERTSVVEEDMPDAGSPNAAGEAGSPVESRAIVPPTVNTRRESGPTKHERRASSQQFDMNNIWAKTAQSPTSGTAPRPMQMPPRRQSSIQQQQPDGTKVDADVDRMLADDDDDTYSPAEHVDPEAVVWRGKLIQSADSVAPSVLGRYVAGRDISRTVSWDRLLPNHLTVDGRLAVEKAEEYLCSLQYSSSSDVSVLAITSPDDPEGFNAFYNYFRSRKRYAVVKEDKPPMVKDLYIIPFEPGDAFPAHIGMLEYNSLDGQRPVQEKCLLATFVIGRAPGTPPVQGAASGVAAPVQPVSGVNGHGQQSTLPQHMRDATQGPSGSPLNTTNPTFSPVSGNTQPQQPHGVPGSPFPPNPYNATPPNSQKPGFPPPYAQPQSTPYPGNQYQMQPGQQGYPPHPNPLVNEILGPLQYCPTAQAVLHEDPNISRPKLEHLKVIFEEDQRFRVDVAALGERLVQG